MDRKDRVIAHYERQLFALHQQLAATVADAELQIVDLQEKLKAMEPSNAQPVEVPSPHDGRRRA